MNNFPAATTTTETLPKSGHVNEGKSPFCFVLLFIFLHNVITVEPPSAGKGLKTSTPLGFVVENRIRPINSFGLKSSLVKSLGFLGNCFQS